MRKSFYLLLVPFLSHSQFDYAVKLHNNAREIYTNYSIDYNQLADAIAMGAEKGTSRANITTNLDGARVSNRIQAPLAVNTRKYSV